MTPTARAGIVLAATAALVQLTTASGAPSAVRHLRTPGPGEIVLKAGQGIHGEYEPDIAPEYAAIADLDAAGNQHLYQQQARALPSSLGGLAWESVGPLGQDDPAEYPQGAIRFARAAGMGSTIAVDPSDASGNSVYVGNMGGLWHTSDSGATWTNLSDKVFTRGAVGAIGVDKADPDNLYAGTGIGYLTTSGDAPGSGIWVSHDKGQTWNRPAQNMKGYATNDIEVTADGVIAGTSNGLYVSTNDGGSFQRVVLPSNASHDGEATGAYANWISAVQVNPFNTQEITVAVGLSQGKKPGPDGQPLSPGNGLYRSTSGPAGPYDYMTTSSLLKHNASSTDPLGRVMLSWVKSGDVGVLWAIVSDAGLAYGQQPAEADLVKESTGESLNATNTTLNGIYRSEDGGLTWTNKATPQSLQSSVNSGLGIYPALGYGIGVQGTYNLWIEADPRDPNNVYFGLEEVFQNVTPTDALPGLASFEIIQRYWDVCGSTTYLENIYKGQSCPDPAPYAGGVSTHPDQHWGIVVPTDSGARMYTANDGGFYRQDSHVLSTNPQRNAFDNDNWTDMNSLATVQPYKVARTAGGEYLTALQDNGGGFFEKGKSGILVSSGDGVNALASRTDPDTFYFTAQGAIAYVTTDHGKTIRAIPADLTGATFLSPMALDPTDDNHLVVAGQDIHETTKGPNTMSTIDPLLYTVVQTDWAASFNAGTSPVETSPGVHPAYQSQAIAVRDANVYVAICGLCRNTLGDPALVHATVATNVGESGCEPKKASTDCWHVAAGKGLPHNSIWNLAIDPADPKTIYVVLNNNSQIGYDPKIGGTQRVMVSHDAGESFTDITGNLPRSHARDVVVRAGRLVIATDNGVFTAPLTGKAWARLGQGLPPVRVNDLHLDPTGRYLTAGVYGRGVWSFDFQGTASSSSGPGPHGEPTVPRAGGIPATGANAAVAVVGVLLGLLAVGTRRLRRAP